MRPLAIVSILGIAGLASGSGHDEWEEGFSPPQPFARFTHVGDVSPATATQPHLAGARIAAIADGAVVSDADSGQLLRVDPTNKLVAALAIGRDAGLLVYDATAKLAYVADRTGDRIVVVEVGKQLRVVRQWRTPAEPFGIALSPDRKTVLVTAIADRALLAYDAASGRERWRSVLEAEPRGVAISGDGTRAVVASLASGALDEVTLEDPRHVARQRALPVESTRSRARGAFTALFIGEQMVIAPYQLEIPEPQFAESSDHYGGSFNPPIAPALAFMPSTGRAVQATIHVNQPRALAWDGVSDKLYLVGLGTDELVRIDNASQVDAKLGDVSSLAGKERCGPDGIALATDGSVLVWCSFTRSIARLAKTNKPNTTNITRGPELAASRLDATHHEGMVLFHSANQHISSFGQMACANCHLDGRADGMSWQIKGKQLQTPVLAGRVVGTAPFKWDGGARDLKTSLRETVTRLGGSGLAKRHIDSLAAYVESIPAPRAPTRNLIQVLRGKRLFESAELGCASCHDGATYTDGSRHVFTGSKTAFDTPSLVGLAASAPYFHDGSAATLEALLRNRGKVHGMSDGALALDDAKVADLIAFLETL